MTTHGAPLKPSTNGAAHFERLLTNPQVLREIFSATGHSLEHEVPMHRLDPQYRLVFGGGGQVDATSEPMKPAPTTTTRQPGPTASTWSRNAVESSMVRSRRTPP